MNIEEVIIICGMQINCRGERAVGEMTFETEPSVVEGGEYTIPICQTCLDFINSRMLTQDDDSATLE